MFNMEGAEHGRRPNSNHMNGSEPREKPHTLYEYSIDHFRLVLGIEFLNNNCYTDQNPEFAYIDFSIPGHRQKEQYRKR